MQENDNATLAELEARARELESELAGIQSAIASLRTRMGHEHSPAKGHDVPLAPIWDTTIPVPPAPHSHPAGSEPETGDIYLVADVLGHKDVNTTRKHYAAMQDYNKRKAAKTVKLREP